MLLATHSFVINEIEPHSSFDSSCELHADTNHKSPWRGACFQKIFRLCYRKVRHLKFPPYEKLVGIEMILR